MAVYVVQYDDVLTDVVGFISFNPFCDILEKIHKLKHTHIHTHHRNVLKNFVAPNIHN